MFCEDYSPRVELLCEPVSEMRRAICTIETEVSAARTIEKCLTCGEDDSRRRLTLECDTALVY